MSPTRSVNGPLTINSTYGDLSPGFPVGGGSTVKKQNIDKVNAGGYTPQHSGGGSANAATSVGVAYRIREKPKPKDVSSKSSPMLNNGPPSSSDLNRSSSSSWIHTEEDEELSLRKELKAAKSRMKKQIQMQDWLEKKEEKALASLEAEEAERKAYEDEQKAKDKQFRSKAKKQKKKLEKYYERLRAEVQGLGEEEGEGEADL